MTTAPEDTRAWSPLRWTGVLVIIFGAQVGLMFWLGRRGAVSAPPARPAMEVRVPEDQLAEIPGADSPTLLVTPNPEGFSSVWLRAPEITNQPAEWTGQPDGTLPRPFNPPGGELEGLVNDGPARTVSVLDRPEPEVKTVGIRPDAVADSSFSLEGDLARRTLLARPALVSPASDAALSNSIVEIDVDAEGVVADPPVIVPGGSSGSAETDAYARRVAKALQFQPLPRAGSRGGIPPAERTWGTVVFEWRTLPAPATNQPVP
jgi:hypothetical protein